MWIAILFIVLALAVASVIYLMSRIKKFYIVRRLAGDSRAKRWILSFIPILGFVIYGIFDVVNAIIVMLHYAVFWLVFDIAAAVVRRVRGEKKSNIQSETASEDETQQTDGKKIDKLQQADGENDAPHIYRLGIAVIITTTVYLIIGFFLAYHVYETDYTLHTEKNLGIEKLRVVQIADSHIGTTFDGDGFAEHMKTIEKTSPDVMVITGDFVDDSTTREDMIRSCEALGQMKTTYGIYYSCGNHDKGYYQSRDFSYDELIAELKKNGVTVLEDETVLVDDKFYIAGRKDRSFEDRMAASEMTEGLDRNKYIIMLDHQPNDYEAEAKSGADLVLSGHTHGGQLIPLGFIGEYLFRSNDRTYGKEVRGNTTFIVTSGISDWAIKFKTGTKSEFVVIDIISE
ncbi:hypothetical protein SAMN04487934_10593 [Eubacterium ruminantium]|nr:hypothetical protein SAMN04487934_10593 [Eubacterium ruminantium]